MTTSRLWRPGVSAALALVLAGCPVYRSAPAIDCDEGPDQVADPMSGTCFIRVVTAQPWAQARLACLRLPGGTRLATIDSAQQNYLVTLLTLPEPHWLGASDLEVEGSWRWVTGESLLWTSWGIGEPNDQDGAEDCLEINHGGNGLWNDISCNLSRPFVCERPLHEPDDELL